MFNERPTREDASTAVAPVEEKVQLPTSCTIHTTQGDIVSPTAVHCVSQSANLGLSG